MPDEKDIAIPFFRYEAEPDDTKTKACGGVPQFKQIEMVRIIIPGMRDCEVDRPVEDKDRKRWPSMYESFLKGEKQEVEGVPLSEFTTATASEIATLKSLRIQTVEQAAELNDDAASKLHCVALKQKARKFLETRKEIGNVGVLMATIEKLEKKIKDLENANSPRTVSGSPEGNGVQPSNGDTGEQLPGREAVGATRKRGRKRLSDENQVAQTDV
jgi:hypothetical protein